MPTSSGSWVYFLWMVAAGVTVACQAPINAALGGNIGRLPAAMVSFCSGALLSVLVVLVAARFFPELGPNWARAKSLPWWMFIGGALGLIFVISATFAVPKTGVANATIAVLVGQLTTAMVVDALGLFGVPAQGFEPKRLLAIPFMAVAVWLSQSRG